MASLDTVNNTKPPSPVQSKKSPPKPTVMPVRHPVRNPKYYIDEQMSIFLVDNNLFRVHRHFLRRESVVFDSMFSCPPPPEGQDGQSDENPIVLPDVKQSEFMALMDYFYQGSFFLNEPGHAISLREYIDLLSIASRYECTGARQKAIQGIESHCIDPIQKIILSEKYNVQHWLMPAYIELCKRDKSLNGNDARQIGIDKAMVIAEARENVRSCLESRRMIYNQYDPLPSGILEDSRVERFVNEALENQASPIEEERP
ncbi:hypothetical protein L218DRAFT_911811 [Marasmius fiardii PR-910]|nr:hypothetical protein L218DRAFT_911811 [Marasmius fiardii PR-910]